MFPCQSVTLLQTCHNCLMACHRLTLSLLEFDQQRNHVTPVHIMAKSHLLARTYNQ
jgi:hypothetical protein